MATPTFFSVITTIQLPTESLLRCSERSTELGGVLIAIGDTRTPEAFAVPGVRYLSLAEQLLSPWHIARAGPTGHYSRKNVGYLEAIRSGANCIFETDDDNFPLPAWCARTETVSARRVNDRGWINVFRLFTDRRIWPRGFPLDRIAGSLAGKTELDPAALPVRAPIQQGLANGSPDVDAIWRLVLDEPIEFRDGPSVLLPAGSWCPFNSQSTWWYPLAFPLLYLPSHCSFRMTDIWRSFVAQRCLWALGMGVVFHGAEMRQERNLHNLLRDFEQEMPGYISNGEIAATLESLPLPAGEHSVAANLRACYEALAGRGFLPRDELALVNDWLRDIESAS
jgi:hypothetical protein